MLLIRLQSEIMDQNDIGLTQGKSNFLMILRSIYYIYSIIVLFNHDFSCVKIKKKHKSINVNFSWNVALDSYLLWHLTYLAK